MYYDKLFRLQSSRGLSTEAAFCQLETARALKSIKPSKKEQEGRLREREAREGRKEGSRGLSTEAAFCQLETARALKSIKPSKKEQDQIRKKWFECLSCCTCAFCSQSNQGSQSDKTRTKEKRKKEIVSVRRGGDADSILSLFQSLSGLTIYLQSSCHHASVCSSLSFSPSLVSPADVQQSCSCFPRSLSFHPFSSIFLSFDPPVSL